MGIQVVERIDYSATSYDANAIRATGASFRGVLGTSSAFCTPDFGQREGGAAGGVYAADKPDDTISASVLAPDARDLLRAARAA